MPNADAYVLLGTIGSGKTIQAANLRDYVNGHALSAGALIRHHLKDDPRVARGELLPHQEVENIMAEAIATVADDQPIIFDGFPREVEQKQWLDQHLSEINRRLIAVFYLKVDEAEVDRRLAARARADDTPQAIARRKQLFEDEVMPVIETYSDEQLVYEIDGNVAADVVSKQLYNIIDKL